MKRISRLSLGECDLFDRTVDIYRNGEVVLCDSEWNTVYSPTPDEAIAKLVRMYARKVRSDARWSRATLPEFSKRSDTPSGRNLQCCSLQFDWSVLPISEQVLGTLFPSSTVVDDVEGERKLEELAW